MPSSAEGAYDAIAPAYDQITHHNDYATWLEILLLKLEGLGLQAGRLLDVGCGSGKAFEPMLERGWDILGCDISSSMLDVARAKAGGQVEVRLADMRKLPVYGSFDLVWSLNDAVNYLVGDGELVEALTGMGRNLAMDGLLLFDCNSFATLRSAFSTDELIEHDGRHWVWSGLSNGDAPAGAIFEARVEGDEIAPHLHRERHFDIPQVRRAMGEAGLECIAVLGQRELDPGVELVEPADELGHDKIVYVGRARQRAR